MELIGVKFKRPGEYGDFRWMIGRDEYADSLFVFNDNEEQFRLHRRVPHPPEACAPGGGNAVIRPYQCRVPPRAAGIPTGAGGRGYEGITDRFRKAVDRAIDDIRKLIDSGKYKKIFFSSDDKGYIGTGIFDVAPENKVYITKSLLLVTAPDGERLTNEEIHEKAVQLAGHVAFGLRMGDFGDMGEEPPEMEAWWLEIDLENTESEGKLE